MDITNSKAYEHMKVHESVEASFKFHYMIDDSNFTPSLNEH